MIYGSLIYGALHEGMIETHQYQFYLANDPFVPLTKIIPQLNENFYEDPNSPPLISQSNFSNQQKLKVYELLETAGHHQQKMAALQPCFFLRDDVSHLLEELRSNECD